MRLAIVGTVLLSGAACFGQAMPVSSFPPMSWIEPLVPEDLPELKYPEYADALDRARQQIRTGRYRLALQTLQLASDADAKQRTLLKARALVLTHRPAEALAELGENQSLGEGDRLRAMALVQANRRADALAVLEKAASAPDSSAQTHLLLAQTLEDAGQIAAAREALEWFKQQDLIGRLRADQLRDIEDADELIAIAAGLDRLAVLTGLYREQQWLHQAILQTFVRAYDLVDRRNADGHVMAAEFFVAHNDPKTAADELERALAINPNHVQALTLLGELSLKQNDTADVEEAITKIRAVNAEHPAAAALEAQLLIALNQLDEAEKILNRLAKADPTDLKYQALLASCDASRADANALPRRLAEIDRRFPDSPRPRTLAGMRLISTGRPRAAAPLLEAAIRQSPHWNMPRNALGLAHMLSPDTSKARQILEQAHDLDPFSIETTNYLRLLDTFDKFKTITSEHFVVRFDPQTDAFVAEEMLQYMEGNYARICGNFAYELPDRTLIELMPTNPDFSVRASGRPWHATYAVTLGPVITIVAPRRGGNTMGNYDWADVMRHEFAHTVVLSQTDGRVPRWLTEGLSVSEQIAPLWYSRIATLAKAVNGKRLLPLRSIDRAITSAKAPELGYSQGYWACRYITEQQGYGKIIELLGAYRQGLSTDAAFRKCLGMSAAEFDERFAAWAQQQVKKIGMDAASQAILEAVKEEGEARLKEKDYAGAVKIFEKAQSVCPVDPEIQKRLAGLYLHKAVDRPRDAVAQLEALDRNQLKDNRYALRLAKLYESQGEGDKAIQAARRATQVDAYDRAPREVLETLLRKAGRTQEADREREIIAAMGGAK